MTARIEKDRECECKHVWRWFPQKQKTKPDPVLLSSSKLVQAPTVSRPASSRCSYMAGHARSLRAHPPTPLSEPPTPSGSRKKHTQVQLCNNRSVGAATRQDSIDRSRREGRDELPPRHPELVPGWARHQPNEPAAAAAGTGNTLGRRPPCRRIPRILRAVVGAIAPRVFVIRWDEHVKDRRACGCFFRSGWC